MESRIPASERTSQKLSALLTEGVADGDARAELLKLAVRNIVEEALEAEVAEVLGRGYYEAGAAPGAGYRNGYRRGRLRTAEGAIEYGVPQVADRPEPFVSRVRVGLAGRTLDPQRSIACLLSSVGHWGLVVHRAAAYRLRQRVASVANWSLYSNVMD